MSQVRPNQDLAAGAPLFAGLAERQARPLKQPPNQPPPQVSSREERGPRDTRRAAYRQIARELSDLERLVLVLIHAAGVACFVKQLGYEAGVRFIEQVAGRQFSTIYTRHGGFWPSEDREHGWILRMKHPKGGDPAEWPEDLRVRELPSGVEVPHG